MKSNKKIMYLVLVLMIVGFAAVSTVLYINGSALIGSNDEEFDIYFSNALVNGVEDKSIIKDKKHIKFEHTFSSVDDTYILKYYITNGSRNYDSNVSINCKDGNDYISVVNSWVNPARINSGETKDGILTLEMIKGYAGEEVLDLDIECEITANGVERESLGEISDNTPVENVYLMKEKTSFPSTITNYSYSKINITNTELTDYLVVEDLSINDDETVKGFVTQDPENNSKYVLSIVADGKVGLPENAQDLFYFSGIQTLTGLENLDMSQVVNMGGLFKGTSINDADLSGWDVSNVANMSDTFSGSTLSNVNMDNWDVSKVTVMASMFQNTRLNNVSLGWKDADSLQVTYQMFMLTSGDKIDISSFDTPNLTNAQGMFQVSTVSEIIIGTKNTSKLTNIDYMFNAVRNDGDIDISGLDVSSVTTASTLMGGGSINSFNMNNLNFSSLNNLGTIFAGTQVKHIYADGLKANNITSLKMLFNNLTGLQDVSMRNSQFNNVTDMSYLFSGNGSSLVKVDLHDMVAPNVTTVQKMFADNINLAEVDMVSFVGSKVTDASNMFEYCTSLETIDLRNFDTSSVQYSGYMFGRMGSKLKNVYVGNNWTLPDTELMFMNTTINAVTHV